LSLTTKYYNLLWFAVGLIACVKDKPNPDLQPKANNLHRGIIVLNEGSFGNNNAEISFLDLEENTISNDLYRTANAKSMGDVAQSIQYAFGKFYILINNSNKIVIIDALDFHLINTITNIPTPRYIQIIDSTKAFITSLTSNQVYIIDLKTKQLSGLIELDYAGSEKMVLYNNDVWICNWHIESPFVYKINKQTNMIHEKINLNCKASHDIVLDKNQKLWILSGNKYKNRLSFLTKLNPITNTIEKQFAFDTNQEPIKLDINQSGDTLYYININYDGTDTNNGLYSMSIDANNLPLSAFIEAKPNSYYWAFGLDKTSHHIFLADPKGFTQQSSVLEYDAKGQLIQSFKAGIGTNYFLFNQ
jgi:DNA-binding beta-propeller fold protein YncE